MVRWRFMSVVAALALSWALSAQGAAASTLPGSLTTGSYGNSSGTLSYELYVPSTYKAGTAVPLVVALHGCTQTADVYRQLSGWDTEAQAKNFIVLFPQQSSSRNSQECWNWFQQADMQRGSGEPAIIAGMVSSVEQNYSIDTKRVYVAGFSAGGAMANVMGATYPDVFAAVGVGSGCEYNGLPCVGAPGPAASQTGQEAYQAMGSYARVMPAIVFQGDADDIVAPANAPLIVSEWQVTDNYAAGGSASGGSAGGGSGYTLPTGSGYTLPTGSWTSFLSGSACSGVFSVLPGCSASGSVGGGTGGTGSSAPSGPIPTAPTGTTSGSMPGGESYTVTTYGDGQGHDLIDYWIIHGMNHAWSGGNSSEQYADPAGPSETDAMYTFFTNHPLP
jgi:poly(hydroxyalkanoate) depolymerase family esterase